MPEDVKTKRKFTSKKSNEISPNDVVATEYGKMPPNDVPLEEAVLGALMLESNAFGSVSDFLKPDCFYKMSNRLIYTAIANLASKQEPIDLMTVTEQLRKEGTLEDAGGNFYVAQLTSKVSSSANVVWHAKILSQKYLSRQLISFATNVEKNAFDEGREVEEVMQEAEGKLFEISQQNLKKDYTQINPLIEEALKQVESAANREGLSGVPSGFNELDKITSGWQNSDLIIIAARPAMGKTAFVLSMAKNMADRGYPVAMFSLEMSNLQLVNRLLVNVSELPGEKIKNGKLESYEWDQLNARTKDLFDKPIYLDDTPSLSVFEFNTKARRLVKEHKVRCIIIDYLQLMNASGMNFGSREQEVSMISRSLKQLSKELCIPIIALSQLNRGVEGRVGEDKRPQLADLRESGAIEQDADMVLFIHRPEYYKITEDAAGNDLHGIAEIIIAKHRNGATGDVRLRFRAELAKFSNMDEGVGKVELDSTAVDGSNNGDDFVSAGTAAPVATPPSDPSDPMAGGNIPPAF
jgi:replicative DNA helicase